MCIAFKIACRLASVIDHGKVIAEGSPNQLISQLGGEHVVEFSLAGGADGIQAGEFLQIETVIRAVQESDDFLDHPAGLLVF